MKVLIADVQIPEIATHDAIVAFKEALISRLSEDVLKIIFFGSRRRGIFRPDSDIDLLVILKKKKKELVDLVFEISDSVEQDILHYEIPLTIHIFTKDEYNRLKGLKSPFITEVEKEGITIYERVAQS